MSEREEITEIFTQWITKKIEALCSLSGRFPMNPDAIAVYAKNLWQFRNSKFIESVYDEYANQAIVPTPMQFREAVRNREMSNAEVVGADKRLAEKQSKLLPESHESVILAYLACNQFVPGIFNKEVLGKARVDESCMKLFGRILSDEELMERIPKEKINSYIQSIN